MAGPFGGRWKNPTQLRLANVAIVPTTAKAKPKGSLLRAWLFWFFPRIHSVWLLTVVAFLILMCYGGGFGTMPAFAADYFGSKNVGPIYGLMLTAWGFASAFGPLLIDHLRQVEGNYRGALYVIAGIVAASLLLPIIVAFAQYGRWSTGIGSKERAAAA
jgi:MFS family permease